MLSKVLTQSLQTKLSCVNYLGKKNFVMYWWAVYSDTLYVHSNAMVWCALFLLVNLAQIVLFVLTDKLLLPVLCLQWTYRTKNSWMSCIILASVLYFNCTSQSIYIFWILTSVFMLFSCLFIFLWLFLTITATDILS